MMHRPAGMSSESDSDELELESSVPFTSYKNHYNFQSSNFNSQSQENNQDLSYEQKSCEQLQEDDKIGAEGFDSISGADTVKKDDLKVKQDDDNERRWKEKSPLADLHNWSFNGNETSYTEKQNYLATGDSFIDKGRHSPSSPRSNNGTRDWRKFRMHQGVALPMEDYRMAVMQGNIAVAKALLSQGIAVDQILKSGWTALMFAASCGKHEMVRYLLEQGADPNMHKEMFTSLMAACAARQECEENLFKCVNHLLDFGAKVNTCERHRMTALMFACKEGRTSIVERLIQDKTDVNKQDNKGWTALCWAATKNHGIVVRKLLGASADPTKMNIHGQRPADIAMAAGHIQLADILERAMSSNSTEEELPSKSEESLVPRISNGGVHLSTHCGEIEMILTGLELTHLIPIFRANKITLECFLRLSEKDFEKMGVDALGTRKTLLEAIAHIHKQEWKTTSLPNLTGLPYISLPDAVAMIANINRHIRFIHASVGHLRDQIQATPRILALGQEKHTVGTLSQELSVSLKNLSFLQDEVKFFRAHLDKVCNNAEYSSVDTIVIQRDDGRQWQRRICASLAVATTVATVLYFCKPKIFSSLFSLSSPQKSVFDTDILSNI